MQKVIQTFEPMRGVLRRLFVQGSFQPGPARGEKSRLLILKEVLGDGLKREGGVWRLECDPARQGPNCLFGAYGLCALHSKANAVRPALLLQALAPQGTAMSPAECTSLLSGLAQRPVDERPVKATLDDMYRDGWLKKAGQGRFALAETLPPPPEGAREEYLGQLNLLAALLPQLAKGRPLQSWGLWAAAALQKELRRRGWYAPPPLSLCLPPRRGHFQLVLEDELLWKLAGAHSLGCPVQVEYQVVAMGRALISEPLQPLWSVTDLIQGRVILTARPLNGRDDPVTLPLDRVSQVWLLPQGEKTEHWLNERAARQWRRRWFGTGPDSWTPQPSDPDGHPAAPSWAEAVFRPLAHPAEWARRLPPIPGTTLQAERDTVTLRGTPAWPGAWDALLFSLEKELQDLRSGDGAFAAAFYQRQKMRRKLGAAAPAPAEAWRWPDPAARRPAGRPGQAELFVPYQNSTVQRALEWIGRAAGQGGSLTLDPDGLGEDLWELLRGGELGSLRYQPRRKGQEGGTWRFTPHICRPVPAPLRWQEKEWLLAFLQGWEARRFLRPSFCRYLAGWLGEGLRRAEAEGLYRPRMSPEFFGLRGFEEAVPRPGPSAVEDETLCLALVGVWQGSEERACRQLRPYCAALCRLPGGRQLRLSFWHGRRDGLLGALCGLLPAVWLEEEGTDPWLFAQFPR